MEVKNILEDISGEWQELQILLKDSLKSDCFFLNKINEYLLSNMGKQLRPMLGILAAKTCGEVNDRTIVVSVVSEIIHCATLLHDDVADNSDKRRGRLTVHKLFSPAAAVLTGDYWLAKALSLVTALNDTKLLDFYIKAVEGLSEGELEQMDKSVKMDTTEADYYKIINGKTAALFVAVVMSAGYTVGAGTEQMKRLESYARHLGIAFQIRDDIFDYTPKMETGKAAGTDIKEKKLTLPLIKALENSPSEERSLFLSRLRGVDVVTEDYVEEVFGFVKRNRGVEIAQSILSKHCREAAESLSIFPDSVYRRHLEDLARYVGTREY